MNIVIVGAGSIGCFTGALLQQAGYSIALLGRDYVLDPIRTEGLSVSDFTGMALTVPSVFLSLSKDPACLRDADLVIVAVKTPATQTVARDIAAYAPITAPILSFQNGLENANILRTGLPGRDVRAGMVPFNVVPKGVAGYHRATSGDIVIQAGKGYLAEHLTSEALRVTESNDIVAVQWGKLVLNLTNALNALSGMTLQNMLLDRNWRWIMADQMSEALSVLKASNTRACAPTPVPTGLIPHLLRLPTPLFQRLASKMLTIDPEARTSMSYDVAAGRHTEIESLQGEILRLAKASGTIAPINGNVADAIGQITKTGNTVPDLDPAELRP
ncbi:MAG: 2-dehydropantoate 2-reductase [Pseudoruegeria sp.]